jgi:hypothetical protein
LLVTAVAFLMLFSFYALFIGFVDLLAQFRRLLFGPPPPETRMTKEEVTGAAGATQATR